MRLEYRILCIDDDISSLEPAKSSLLSTNNAVGIETKYVDIEVKPTAREPQKHFKNRIKKEVEDKYKEGNSFDLIMIDLHMQDASDDLPDPIGGADFVEMVREHTMYKPIIFYSGGIPKSDQKARAQLHDAMEKAEVWGKNLMVCPRDSLPRFLEKIAIEMHAEEHKINHVRGLLMDSVSEIDAKIILALRSDIFWNNIPESKRDSILSNIRSRVSRKASSSKDLKDLLDSMEFLDVQSFFADKSNDRSLDMNIKSELLREMLKVISGMEDYGKILSTFYNGTESLTNTRNDYAHQTAKTLSSAHTHDKFKLIREESRKHLKNINNVHGDN